MSNARKLLSMGTVLAVLLVATILLIYFTDPEVREKNTSSSVTSPLILRQMLITATQLFEEERYPEAERLLRRLLRLDPNNITALRMLGNLQYITRRYFEASTTFRVILARNPRDPVARSNLGMSMVRLQWYEAGIRELLTARAQDPDLPFIDLNLGNAYQELGDSDKASYYLRLAEQKGLPANTTPIVPGGIPHE